MREFILIENGLRKATFEHLKDAIECVTHNPDIELDKCCIMEHVLIEQYHTIPYSEWRKEYEV